ncbi:MAG TPA: DUF4437 domain-containing protein [Trichormus sp.]|jgi:hypothetical protein
MRKLLRAGMFAAFACLSSVALADDKGASAPGKPDEKTCAFFMNYKDMKWTKINPNLGADSPELCILYVDPKTKESKMMLRSPTAIHVRKHWHSHNETHTVLIGTQVYACKDKKMSQPPGSFNRMPAKMIHEAWVPAGSLVFITMDGEWDIHWVDGEPTAKDLTK